MTERGEIVARLAQLRARRDELVTKRQRLAVLGMTEVEPAIDDLTRKISRLDVEICGHEAEAAERRFEKERT